MKHMLYKEQNNQINILFSSLFKVAPANTFHVMCNEMSMHKSLEYRFCWISPSGVYTINASAEKPCCLFSGGRTYLWQHWSRRWQHNWNSIWNHLRTSTVHQPQLSAEFSRCSHQQTSSWKQQGTKRLIWRLPAEFYNDCVILNHFLFITVHY